MYKSLGKALVTGGRSGVTRPQSNLKVTVTNSTRPEYTRVFSDYNTRYVLRRSHPENAPLLASAVPINLHPPYFTYITRYPTTRHSLSKPLSKVQLFKSQAFACSTTQLGSHSSHSSVTAGKATGFVGTVGIDGRRRVDERSMTGAAFLPAAFC